MLSRTYPEIAPDTDADHAGTAAVAVMTATATINPSFRNISPTTSGRPGSRSLLHSESRCRTNRLLGKVVVHFDFDLIEARLQIRRRERFFQRDLIPYVPHRVG